MLPCDKKQWFSASALRGFTWQYMDQVFYSDVGYRNVFAFFHFYFFFHLLPTLIALKRHSGEPCYLARVESCHRLGLNLLKFRISKHSKIELGSICVHALGIA